MRSKTSYFNRTLFLKNLSRFWPLWGGASFVGALFPLALLSQLLRHGVWGGIETPLMMTYNYYLTLQGVVPIVCLLYGVLCAEAVWSYLYHARSVSLMHTLPIRREGLFVTNFLSGLAMLLIPFAVTGALCVAVSAAFGLLEPVGLMVTVLGVLGESFFYFASATFAAFVTGNVFALPAVYLVLHFLEAVLDLLLSNFARGFIFGLTTDYTGVLEFLSPTVYLMRNVRVATERRDITNAIGEYIDSELVAVWLEDAWLIAVYALVGVVLTALAFALYRRRSSERAGDVVAVAWMRPVFRYGVAALAALLGGQLLYSLFWDDGHFKVGPLILCMLVAGVIGWYGASMLLAKTLRVFRRDNWKGLVLVAAGVIAVCGCLRLDLMGAADRVPEAGQIQELTLRTDGNTYTFHPGEGEDELLEQVRALHAAIAADRDYILALEDEYLGTPTASADLDGTVRSWTRVSVALSYLTTGGQRVNRYYYVPLTRDRLGQSGTYDNLLDTLVDSQEMRLKRLHASGDGYTPTGGSIYPYTQSRGYDLSDREAAAILDAVARDAQAGRWGQTDWFGSAETDRGTAYAMDLHLEFRRQAEERNAYDWISINVRPAMTATTACLLELGLVTGEDLVTYAEMYPEEYGDVGNLYPETAVPASAEVVYPEPIYPETAFHPAVMGVVS